MNIDWNEEKNEWLEKNRELSFEIVAEKILCNEIIDDGVFLKTIYPDRKMTKKYLGVKDENDR